MTFFRLCYLNPTTTGSGLILCRLCLGAWSDHGERTGGFYACNRYETAKQEGVVYTHSVLFLRAACKST